MDKQRIVIIRISGDHNLNEETKSTLKMLRLYNKYGCSIVPNNNSNIGMIKTVKEHITWGEINEETFTLLLEKRGRLSRNKRLTEEYLKNKTNLTYSEFAKDFISFNKELSDIEGLKLYFRLTPPRGGFERKGTKQPFSMGGTLGYRKEKVNDLIRRMI